MKFLKLKVSLLALFTTLAASGFGSFNLQAKAVNAEISDKYYIGHLQGNKTYYGRPLDEGRSGTENRHVFLSDLATIGFEGYSDQADYYETHTSYRDVIASGKDVTGKELYNLYKNNGGSDEWWSSAHNHMLNYDGIILTQCNTNIHIDADDGYTRIGLSFDGTVVDILDYISEVAGCGFVLPCLYFDNIPVAYFSVTHSTNNDIYVANGNRNLAVLFDKNIISRGVVFTADSDLWNHTDIYAQHVGEKVMLIDVAGDSIPKISSVSQITYSPCVYTNSGDTWKINSGSRYDYTQYMFNPGITSQHLRIRTYHNAQVAPAEIGLLKVASGAIVLTHPLTREKYGFSQNTWFLKSITMSLYSQGEYVTERYSIATESEYENFVNTGTFAPKKMYWGPRYPFDSEYESSRTEATDRVVYTGQIGSGGLVYGYQMCGGQMVRPSHSSIITVLSAEFYQTNDAQSRFEFYSNISNPVEVSISYTDEYRYNYYADPCTTRIHADMYERNESGDDIAKVEPTNGAYIAVGIGSGLGIVGAIITWLTCQGVSKALSQGRNIQRFYFNFFDLFVNESIPLSSVTKLQFKYQLGNYPRETIGYKWIDDNDHSKGYRGIQLTPVKGENAPKILTETVEAQPNSNISTNFFGIDISTEKQDVFVDCTEKQVIVDSVRYNYFFQHIYHVTVKDDVVTKAPDWMCYYSPLSVWYTTTGGDTVRGTTDKEGYYIAEDANGKQIVMNLNDPEHPSDMTVDEFLGRDTDTTVINYDEPEQNDADAFITNIKNWFESIGEWFQSAGNGFATFFKILAIIAIVVIVIILLVLIIRFIRWIYRSLHDDRGGHRRN